MTLKKFVPLVVLGGLLNIAPSISSAAQLDTTTATPDDGVLQNFTGIDWHANGGGWIQGFDLTGANNAGDTDTFTLTYQAFAVSINSTSPTPNLYVSSPGSATGSYELTTYSVLQETATCVNDGCSIISVQTNSGTWTTYFDISPDADQSAGTGFRDGVSILNGTWSGASTPAVFSSSNGGVGPGGLGTGSATLVGTVTGTNNAFINPDLLGTDFQSSLQFPGQQPPSYTRPAAFDGAATGPDTATDFVLQVDGSQSFTEAQVPEPATMLLMGMGLIGVGFSRKRL